MALSPADFDYLRTLVQERSAIVLENDKAYLVEMRLLALARRRGVESVSALVAQLSTQVPNGLHQEVVETMTTNETSFFRDFHPFEALRKTVLPELVRMRMAERRLHIWSAACSSGQEAYSIAMLIQQNRCVPPGWDLRLLASDLSKAMVERARAGRYSQLEVNRGLPAPLLLKHFKRDGLEWQLQDDVRRMVEFSRINLIDRWTDLPAMDVIFLRNVLIYFDVTTKKRILANVRRRLRPGGYLFLGGVETTFNLDDAYERVALDRGSCYRLPQS